MSTIGVPHHQESTYFGNAAEDAERQAERAARFHARDVAYRAALRIPDHVRLPKSLGLTVHSHGDDDRRRGGGADPLPQHLVTAP